MKLFINACVRENSRTKRIADYFLSKQEEPFVEVRLDKIHFPVVDDAFLAYRDQCVASGRFDDPVFDLAKQFALAEEIVIAAPLYDLSFPASLKQYFEQINVIGLTFAYSPYGEAESLCHCKRLTYISTAGGGDYIDTYGYGYVKALGEYFYGIKETRLIQCAGLDIVGADIEAILQTAFEQCDK